LRGKKATFSSDVNDGPVMVTGIYKSEDLLGFLQENSVLNRILDSLIKKLKINNRLDDPVHTEKCRLIRLLCM
jgi:hypothetical protein